MACPDFEKIQGNQFKMMGLKENAPGIVKRSLDLKSHKKIVSVHTINAPKMFKEDNRFEIKDLE